MGELFHECGVAAVYHTLRMRSVSALTPPPGGINSVARLRPRMLLDMQNRRSQLARRNDELSAGAATPC